MRNTAEEQTEKPQNDTLLIYDKCLNKVQIEFIKKKYQQHVESLEPPFSSNQ